MAKKTTFTCKICGGEHAGLICTKYAVTRAMPTAQRRAAVAPLAVPPALKPKAKKAKRAKKAKAAS